MVFDRTRRQPGGAHDRVRADSSDPQTVFGTLPAKTARMTL
jgi:hypothetical protein